MNFSCQNSYRQIDGNPNKIGTCFSVTLCLLLPTSSFPEVWSGSCMHFCILRWHKSDKVSLTIGLELLRTHYASSIFLSCTQGYINHKIFRNWPGSYLILFWLFLDRSSWRRCLYVKCDDAVTERRCKSSRIFLRCT